MTTTAAPRKTARVSHAKTTPRPAPAELPTISSVKLVPLALIDVRPQVRTTFDDAGLQELAGDILARGLLQPVLLNPNGDRYTLIAGERRVRACSIAGLSDIPALITKANESDALLMQLAENIQREALDLGDTVKAVRLLHDTLQSVAEVANQVKKSPAWVSKRLALSHPDLNYQARQLMEDGVTEDVEILNAVSTLFELNWSAGREQLEALRAGTATRESVRQALKEAKASTPPKAIVQTFIDPEQRKRETEEREAACQAQKEEQDWHDIERKEGTGPLFIEAALTELQIQCAEFDGNPENNATTYLNGLREDQRGALLSHLQQLQAEAKGWDLAKWAKALTPYDSEYSYLELFVAVMATKKPSQGIDNLYALVTTLETANDGTQ